MVELCQFKQLPWDLDTDLLECQGFISFVTFFMALDDSISALRLSPNSQDDISSLKTGASRFIGPFLGIDKITFSLSSLLPMPFFIQVLILLVTSDLNINSYGSGTEFVPRKYSASSYFCSAGPAIVSS